MAKLPLKLVAPSTVNRTVLPKRRKNGELRTREFLTETEVERLIKAAKAKNNEAMALSYVKVSLACFNCHNHVREIKISR